MGEGHVDQATQEGLTMVADEEEQESEPCLSRRN